MHDVPAFLNTIIWEPNQRTLFPIWRILLLHSINYLILHSLKLSLYGDSISWTYSASSRFLCCFISCATAILAWKYLDRNKREMDVFRYFGIEFMNKEFLLDLLYGTCYAAVAVFVVYIFTVGFTLPHITLNCSNKLIWLFAWLAHSIHEEIQYRGYILSTYKNTTSSFSTEKISPALLSASLFCLVHAGNPNASFMAIINLFIFGLLLFIVSFMSGRLGMAIGIHLTWNYLLMIMGLPISGVSFHPPNANSLTTQVGYPRGDFGPEDSAAFVFCNLVAVYVFTQICKKSYVTT